MTQLTRDAIETFSETKECPQCGQLMMVRENTTTFWEKQKERYGYYCSNSNCLHKVPLRRDDIDIIRVEQSLLKWEIDLETIEQEILEKYELKELLRCLRNTVKYLRNGEGNLTAKEHFLQELRNPGGPKKMPWKWRAVLIPVLFLVATISTITLLAPYIGTMMEASILSLMH